MAQASGQYTASASGSETESSANGGARSASDRPSASWIRDQLIKIHTEKQNHVHRHGKDRPEHWHQDYQNALTALHWAAIGYSKLAERESA